MGMNIRESIGLKTAITLRILLSRNKATVKKDSDKKELVNSYEKISMNSSADIRKATVTNAFNGETRSEMSTIVLIVESMGYTLRDFAEVYDKITEKDISAFQKEVIEGKNKKI